MIMKKIKQLIVATVLATDLGSVSVYPMVQEKKPKKAVAQRLFSQAQVEQANRHLFDAIKSSDIEGVRQAVKSGAHVNNARKYGSTPLHWAVIHATIKNAELGYLEIVRILIAAGAEVNRVCDDGFSPLYLAAYHDNAQMVQVLAFNGAIRSGSLCNVSESSNMKAIIKQTQKDRKEVLKALAEQKQLEHDLSSLSNFPVVSIHTVCSDYAAPYCQDPFLQQMIYLVKKQKSINHDQPPADMSCASVSKRSTCVLL